MLIILAENHHEYPPLAHEYGLKAIKTMAKTTEAY